VIARPVRRLVVAIRSPVPIFNVFKSQFENTDIFNFQLSIFNSRFARGRVHVAANDRRYGGVRGTAGGQ
ncbi:MAG: hypothetical protein IKQ04_05435, partial [Oscillospiraceae bacterium]|nr:hypothetical protein [Oscillospiraceae bacterium]